MSLHFPPPGTGNPLYALEKLVVAVHELDQLGRPLKASLYEAGIELIKIAERDMPKGVLRWAFAAIKRELTHVEPKQNEGGLIATIEAMTEPDCIAITERIRTLCSSLDARLKA